jgi:hypothetical protein
MTMTIQVLMAPRRGTRRMHASLKLMAALATACTLAVTGCATQGGSGAAIGTGIGALAGNLIGGDTEATLIGAAVGAGVGYLIGNERDKETAARMRAEEATAPLGGTRWEVVDWSPRESRVQFASKIVEFRPDGRVVTTTTYRDGASTVDSETYRIAGDTLIVNKPGYIVNYRYAFDGGRMTLQAERMRATLRRI